MDKEELDAQRYSVLGQIWAHQNETQLQWPVVAVGVVLIGLGTLLSSSAGNDTVKAISSWGALRSPVIGVFFLLAGLITLLMVRTMRRAREIMAKVACEIDRYDHALGLPPARHFSALNRPLKGLSGPLLLALVLIVMATLSCVAGLFLSLGRVYGAVGSTVFFLLALYQAGVAIKTYRVSTKPIFEELSRVADTRKQ
jgi:uncharacterized BrkB/YihY/UPF0761 family membrane protein